MKKLYLIGNHKMNLSKKELEVYFDKLKEIAENSQNVVGVCVPSVYLDLASRKLAGSKVLYGVQNVYYKNNGAYTGEISTSMIGDFNAQLVIVGHSERRTLFGETDEIVNAKTKKVLESGTTPILCFGETLEERESAKEKEVVEKQLLLGLEGMEVEQIEKIIFAYEPVWAIGTGKTATSEQAEEIISFAKDIISKKYEIEKNTIVMLYGGSLKGSNAFELLGKPSIDGGLIGGACLKLDEYKTIIDTIIE